VSRYLVLGRAGETTWQELGTFDGGSADQAIRVAAQKYDQTVVFLAVPERSAKPLRVERTEIVQVRVKPEGDAA